jgi:hypothetical protein
LKARGVHPFLLDLALEMTDGVLARTAGTFFLRDTRSGPFVRC